MVKAMHDSNYRARFALLRRLEAPPLRLRQDTVYPLPLIVENFIQHANKELPRGFVAVPWTLNRAVSIFRDHSYVACFMYEQIEQNIVRCLDILPKLVRDVLDHASDHHLY